MKTAGTRGWKQAGVTEIRTRVAAAAVGCRTTQQCKQAHTHQSHASQRRMPTTKKRFVRTHEVDGLAVLSSLHLRLLLIVLALALAVVLLLLIVAWGMEHHCKRHDKSELPFLTPLQLLCAPSWSPAVHGMDPCHVPTAWHGACVLSNAMLSGTRRRQRCCLRVLGPKAMHAYQLSEQLLVGRPPRKAGSALSCSS